MMLIAFCPGSCYNGGGVPNAPHMICSGGVHMGRGICICGLNGSGKTTLARALAAALHSRHMDVEDYYFPASDGNGNPYAAARTRDEVEEALLADIRQNPRFVFSAVNGNMRAEITAAYALIVYLEVPAEIRLQRIRARAAERFGARILPGGDMHEQEEKFFAFAAGRQPDTIEAWLDTMPCRVIRLDGTKPIEENVAAILALR